MNRSTISVRPLLPVLRSDIDRYHRQADLYAAIMGLPTRAEVAVQTGPRSADPNAKADCSVPVPPAGESASKSSSVFTQEELDELYKRTDEEPWWNM